MKRLALAAVLTLLVSLVVFVASAQEKPEPTLYVQVAFYSTLNGDADAEAEAAWKSFVAEVNKIQGCVGTFKPRPDKSMYSSVEGAINQPCLTAAQLATFSVEVGKLVDASCFKNPQFSMKLARHPIEIRELQKNPMSEPRTNVPSGPLKPQPR